MSLGGKGGLKEGLPDLADLPVSRDVSEERQKARERMSIGGQGGLKEGTENFQGVNLGKEPNGPKLKSSEIVAKRAGVGHGSIQRILAVYRNRPDLFELVFDGGYSASSSSINVSNSFISSTFNALAIASSARFG